MLQDLGVFLKSNNFTWEKLTRCFNRIYFSPDGAIDYFLFDFPPGQIEPEKEKEFEHLLNVFIKTTNFL